jgi:hypothetical protein
MTQYPPTFFFSHARQDRETPGNYLRQFFQDLEKKVAQLAGIDLKSEGMLGAVDLRIGQGEDWDDKLAAALQTDKAFLAILTPLYFNRPNCGKELGAFLLRSPNLSIDSNGALTGVLNVIPIRWLPEYVYAGSAGPNSLIPAILRRIEDTPQDTGEDPARSEAIQAYRLRGMEGCVSGRHYIDLLNLIAARIRDLGGLGRGPAITFATATDAFRHDWVAHFQQPAPAVASVAPVQAPDLQPLASVVVFYVTSRPVLTLPTKAPYAERLIADTPAAGASADPAFSALLADVKAAATAEGLSLIHALPFSNPDRAIQQLAALSDDKVLTAVIIDPDSRYPPPEAVQTLIRSTRWAGPVLLESAPATSAATSFAELSARMSILPQLSADRIIALRSAFLLARGAALRRTVAQPSEAAGIPVLTSV